MENEIFRKNLRFLRKRTQLSERKMSELLEISKTSLRKYETGELIIKPTLANKISSYFKFSFEILSNIELEKFEYKEVLCRMYITKKQYYHLCMKVISGKVQERQEVLIQIVELITMADGKFTLEKNTLEYYPNSNFIPQLSGSFLQIGKGVSRKTITQLLSQKDEENEVVQDVVDAINQAFYHSNESHCLWKAIFIKKYIFKEDVVKIKKEFKLNNKSYYEAIENAEVLICNQLDLYEYKL